MTRNKEKLTLKEKSIKTYEAIREELSNPIQRIVFRRKVGMGMGNILRGFIFFGLAFIILFPILQQLIMAVKAPSDLLDPLVNYIPTKLSLINVKISIKLLDYWKALFNNIKMSALTTIFQVFSTALAGYAFARLKFKGINIIFLAVMLTLIVPPQAVSLSRALYLADFDIFGIIGLFNNGKGISLRGQGKDEVLYVMAATGQGIKAALGVFIFRQFFRGIPIELEESSQIDGAGVFKTFWSVMLPNARGAIITVALFSFVWQWNDSYYIQVYQLNSSEFPIMTFRLLNVAEWIGNLLKDPLYKDYVDGLVSSDDIKANGNFAAVIANTSALLMMTPLLIAYLFVQKQFVEGVERSGIVG